MKLIIDIPEEVRNDVLTDGVLYCDYDSILRDAIKNSIVLSECKPEDDIPKIGNIDDFIEFGEKAFGVELTIKKSDSPNTQEPRWIPVSERLPEERHGVLVWCPTRKNIYCACYEEKQWWIFGAYLEKVTEEIVAWMPLPKAYSEDEE